MGKGRRGLRRTQEVHQRAERYHPQRRDTKHWRSVRQDWERQGRNSLEEEGDDAPRTDD